MYAVYMLFIKEGKMKPQLFIITLVMSLCLAACSTPDVPANGEPSSEAPSMEAPSGEAPSSPEPAPAAFHPDTKKYYDYFEENNHVSMILDNETGGKGFSDAEMAGYALSECGKLRGGVYDPSVGFPKEEIDAVTMKYFGATIQDYNNRISTAVPETGNVAPTGWSPTMLAFMLKELSLTPDGTKTAVFYYLAFGMDEDPQSAKSDLLQGKLEDYGQPHLTRITFEEKTDENGEMYLLFHEIKPEGEASPPYRTYQG
jgi:hypothetical protein